MVEWCKGVVYLFTRASNWYWRTVGQGKSRGGMFYFSCFFPFIPVPLSSVTLFGVVGWGKDISCVTGASNEYWLTVGQGLLPLQQAGVEGEGFYFCFITFILLYLFHHFRSFSSFSSVSFISSTISSLFSLSLGDDTNLPTRADVSLNTYNGGGWMVRRCRVS